CLCFLPGWRLGGLVWHGRVFECVRAGNRHQKQSLHDKPSVAWHADARRGEDGGAGLSGSGSAKPPIHPPSRTHREASTDALSAIGHRSTTTKGNLVTMVAVAAQRTVSADANDAAAVVHI